jgi:anaerobic selenocysteine-containing dehydrogenase
MQAEQYDIMVTWGHLYIMLNQPAIPAPGECVANIDLFRKLAKTMGFNDEYWDLTDDQWLTMAYDWSSPALEGITLDVLKKEGWKRLNVGMPDVRAPHAEGNFKTPSGKCEFKSSMAEGGNMVLDVWRSGYTEMQEGSYVDPVPNFIPPHEVVDGLAAKPSRFPLNMLSPKPHAFLNTQYGNEVTQMKRQGEQRIMINPSDAASRSIANGAYVRVYNDRGTFEARADLTEDVGVGLIVTNVGHWPGLNRTGTAVNSTTAPRHANLGQAGVYSDNRVEVERV